MMKELFDRLDIVARRQFAVTADLDGLLLQGADYGMPRLPAEPAIGTVTVTAGDAGASITSGALFRRADGVEYRALAAASRASAGDVTVAAIATSDGAGGNALAGTPLVLVSGVSGTGATVAVGSDGMAAGMDVEDVESYRARILFRKRFPPEAGAASDYWRWAREVSGVTRVFVEPMGLGLASVRVFVLMDERYDDGLGPPAEAQRVASYIATKQPSGANVAVEFPVAHVIDVTISGLEPLTTAVEEEVIASLRDAFDRLGRVAGIATPHAGMDFLATPETFSRSWLWQAVANAAGEERHGIVAPELDVPLATGEIAVLGTVTFA
ncbi:MAG TPA: baseplate J/gp47 family protein, partial [Hyphomicrobiales bacterium]|nr:baseplate J/gp47 family protein [Hyphomicrobiales bacterium]